MRSGLGQGADRASGVTRRVVRLVVLLGAAVAAYLVLSLFDREARADAGPIGEPIDQVAATDPVATVKALPHPKPVIPKPAIPKSAIPKSAIPQSVIPQSTAPKAPRIRGGETVRRVQVRTSKVLRPVSDAVRDGVRATVSSARTAVVRPKLPTPDRPALPALPRVSVPKQTTAPIWHQPLTLTVAVKVPTPVAPLPTAHVAPLPKAQGSPLPKAHVVPLPKAQASPLPKAHVSPLPKADVSPLPRAHVSPLPQAPAEAAAPRPSDVAEQPAAQARPPAAPLPATPRQPADRSTSTGQARDPGGGNAPLMATVSSSWRPEVAVAGHRPATDLRARGRTVRYAGPPS